MAAASDSQGLKIAVAAFVTLTVVLAVATYFAYSSYAEASAKMVDEQKKAADAQQAAATALRNFDALKERAGYRTIEDFAALQDAIKKDNDKVAEQLTNLSNQVKQQVEAYAAAGGDPKKIAEIQNAAEQAVTGVTSLPEPNRTFAETQNRLLLLLDDLSQLNTQIVVDNGTLRANLASVDQTNKEQLDVQSGEVKKAKDDLTAEHDAHENARQDVLRKYDDLQNLTAQQATEIAGLKQQLAQMKDTTDKQRAELMAQLRQWREQVERKEDVLDTEDGRVKYVDYARGEIRTNITRAQGAKERMQFAVFDRNAPGLPTDKPKGLVELIQVGENGSVGKILRTNVPSEPIRDNDILYSAAWSPNKPETFALIGKIDVDRDGRDDRADLKRMIEAAGGQVVYDLPPPGVGKEWGQMSASTSWYVTDDRLQIHPNGKAESEAQDKMDQEYLTHRGKVIEDARLNGIRPISIERLLAYLGYKYGQNTPGRVEAIDPQAQHSLMKPKVVTPPKPTDAKAETPAP